VAVTCTPVACAEPRLRRVMLGRSSGEMAKTGALVPALSLARCAAEPVQALLLQVPKGNTALRSVEGRAAVGVFASGRS